LDCTVFEKPIPVKVIVQISYPVIECPRVRKVVECENFYSSEIIIIAKSINTVIYTGGSLISIIHVGLHITRHAFIYDTNARSHKQVDAKEDPRLE